MLERAEEQRAELQVQVLVAFRLVILARVLHQPVHRVRPKAPGNDAVSIAGDRSLVASLSLAQRTISRHGFTEEELGFEL